MEEISSELPDLKASIAKEQRHLRRDQQIIDNYERKNKFESQLYLLKDQLSRLESTHELKEFINR